MLFLKLETLIYMCLYIRIGVIYTIIIHRYFYFWTYKTVWKLFWFLTNYSSCFAVVQTGNRQHCPLELSVLSSQAGRQPKIWTHFTRARQMRRLLSEIRPKQKPFAGTTTKRRYNFFVRPNPIKLNAASRRQQLGSDWQTATVAATAAAAHSILARVSAQLARCCKDCEHMPPAGAASSYWMPLTSCPLAPWSRAVAVHILREEQGQEEEVAEGLLGFIQMARLKRSRTTRKFYYNLAINSTNWLRLPHTYRVPASTPLGLAWPPRSFPVHIRI